MNKVAFALVTVFLLLSHLTHAGPRQTSNFIKIDQFGYLNDSKKVAVISNPQVGFNASSSFAPGTGANQYQVRRWADDVVVFSGTLRSWKSGATHAQSGDQGWHFDFSNVKASGSYYIFDTKNNVGSYRFDIGPQVYENALKHSVRMFYYQRLNMPKLPQYAGNEWQDGTNFDRGNQDRFATSRFNKGNMATAKDLHGGWMDAGDVNKYTTFAEPAVIQLAEAYRINPSVFKDNYGIPESGNGIPDILDELMYELEFLKRMQNATGTGGLFLKVGVDNYNDVSPISRDARPRYYLPECTSSTLAGAAMFAVAGQSLKTHPRLVNYGNELINRARNAWNRGKATTDNFTRFQLNCDDGDIKAGDADRDGTADEQIESALIAAVYLYEATGSSEFRSFVESRYTQVRPMVNSWWGPYRNQVHLALLRYSQMGNVSTSVSSNIRNQKSSQNGVMSVNDHNSQSDLYLAHMPDAQYGWSSNQVKANCGNINLDFITFKINPSFHPIYREISENHLHYLHGVNPLSLMMLSNMDQYGGENSVNEIYHTWFLDGTVWDHAKNSTHGPAPGFLTGGPNKRYDGSLANVANQPHQKAYRETNSKAESVKSWTLTEPAIYTQAAYVALLSGIMIGTSDVEALKAPTGLATSALSTTSFTLSWQDPNSAEDIAGYDIFNGSTKVNSALVTNRNFNVRNLAPNMTYSMSVQAVAKSGAKSPRSSAIQVKTLDVAQVNQGIDVYRDQLAADWANWSWGTSVNLQHTLRKNTGNAAISCNFTTGFGALSLRKGTAVNGSTVSQIRFWVYATAVRNLLVQIQTQDSGGNSAQIPITTSANSWKEIVISRNQLGNPSQIKRINIQSNHSNSIGEVLFDDIRITTGSQNARIMAEESTNFTDEQLEPITYFPNPATDKIQVVFHSKQNEEIQIQIYTIKGEKVYSSSEFVSVGRNEIQIPVQSLFHGQYILTTKTAEGIFTHKFIKQ